MGSEKPMRQGHSGIVPCLVLLTTLAFSSSSNRIALAGASAAAESNHDESRSTLNLGPIDTERIIFGGDSHGRYRLREHHNNVLTTTAYAADGIHAHDGGVAQRLLLKGQSVTTERLSSQESDSNADSNPRSLAQQARKSGNVPKT